MLVLILMAVIQGLTEFLPISSSGHLLFIQSLYNIKDINLAIDIFLHLATFLVIIIYFFKDIKSIILNFVKTPFDIKNDQTRLAYFIVLANIPTAIIGIILKKYFYGVFESGNILYITWSITAILLIISDMKKGMSLGLKDITIKTSLIIGLAQGIAIFPGISRSGITIIIALLLGFNRKDSARFSFLIGLPAMLGASLMELKSMTALNIPVMDLTIAFVITFITGLAGIFLLIKLLRIKKLKYFGFYLITLIIIKILFKL